MINYKKVGLSVTKLSICYSIKLFGDFNVSLQYLGSSYLFYFLINFTKF